VRVFARCFIDVTIDVMTQAQLMIIVAPSTTAETVLNRLFAVKGSIISNSGPDAREVDLQDYNARTRPVVNTEMNIWKC
jgi:hypothetical protein